ncbi:hypothetical protein ACEPAH_3921 [Sanghuangporus vaninii]
MTSCGQRIAPIAALTLDNVPWLESSEFTDYHNSKHHEVKDSSESLWQEEHHTSLSAGRTPVEYEDRYHILPHFKRGGAPKTRISPQRVALVPANHELEAVPQPNSGTLSVNQRTGASNNLADMMFYARGRPGAPTNSASPYMSPAPLIDPESNGASTHEVAKIGESRAASSDPASAPQKMHISSNTIIEQCIAIDSGSVPMSPSTGGQSRSSYNDDGYAEDTEDGLYEDVGTDRPRLRRSSTGSNKSGRSRNSTSASSYSGSGSNSGHVSETNRSRSSVALDREHVTIAPTAPIILKTGATEDNEYGVLYTGSSLLPSLPSSPGIVRGSGTYQGHRRIGNGGMFVGSSGYGYGYSGYGNGEHISVGPTAAFEHCERGTEAGELVYHSPTEMSILG